MARAASENVRREARALRIELLRDLGRNDEADELAAHPVMNESAPSAVATDEAIAESVAEAVMRANRTLQGSSFGTAGTRTTDTVVRVVGDVSKARNYILGPGQWDRGALFPHVSPSMTVRVVGDMKHAIGGKSLDVFVSAPIDIVDAQVVDVEVDGTHAKWRSSD